MADKPTRKYRELRDAIAEEKKRRVDAHRANMVKRAALAKKLGADNLPLNLFAQGDSWFDYAVPNATDVIAQLRALPAARRPEVLSMAVAGEAAEDMLGVKKLHELIEHLEHPKDGRFDAILFSGGGNDIAGDQFRLWLNKAAGAPPAAGLNQRRLSAILEVVRAGYEDLIEARNAVDKTIPIFAHSYDFAIPNGKGVCGKGPWLQPGLEDRGWTDEQAKRAILRELLTQFARMLDDLEKKSPNFIHVKTQGVLADNQWANELHPKPKGFEAIAAKFVDALHHHFPTRI
jgi:hypothetical protein